MRQQKCAPNHWKIEGLLLVGLELGCNEEIPLLMSPASNLWLGISMVVLPICFHPTWVYQDLSEFGFRVFECQDLR